MYEIDRLQRTDHYADLDDLARVVAADDVDAVHHRGRLGLVAGPAWLHTSASAESLAYTEYRLGGHSTAFSEDHRIAFEFPADSLGLDLGGFVEVDLASHVGVRLDLRYTWAPERDAAVVLLGDSPDAVFTVDRATVAHDLAPAPVRLDPSLFRAAVLLSLRF